MDIRLQIKSLLNQAELYRSQGLLTEAIDKYRAAAATLRRIERLKNKESLLTTIATKIQAIEEKKEKTQIGPASPELSGKGQDLIKNLFGEDDLQKAIALVTFGQYERAMEELTPLLQDDGFRVEAAKHILHCKLASDSVEDAIDQYHQWYAGELFTVNQTEAVRGYLQSILETKGIDRILPAPVGEPGEPNEPGGISLYLPESEESLGEVEWLDVTAIAIHFTHGSQEGKMVEFDVNFQSGNLLSLIIPKKDQALIDELEQGDLLDDVQFYSPIAIFNGTARVTGKTVISDGPKQGDFCLDLKITGT